MAKNEVYKVGATLSAPVANGTVAGTPLRLGVLNAVAQTDEAGTTAQVGNVVMQTGGIGNAEGYTSVKFDGVWNLPVTGALTYGAIVYIKSDGTLTATSTGNFVFGAAVSVTGTGTNNALVKILQPAQTAASA